MSTPIPTITIDIKSRISELIATGQATDIYTIKNEPNYKLIGASFDPDVLDQITSYLKIYFETTGELPDTFEVVDHNKLIPDPVGLDRMVRLEKLLERAEKHKSIWEDKRADPIVIFGSDTDGATDPFDSRVDLAVSPNPLGLPYASYPDEVSVMPPYPYNPFYHAPFFTNLLSYNFWSGLSDLFYPLYLLFRSIWIVLVVSAAFVAGIFGIILAVSAPLIFLAVFFMSLGYIKLGRKGRRRNRFRFF